jgi:hypothetical protein
MDVDVSKEAQSGFEPETLGYEPRMIPFHHRAPMFKFFVEDRTSEGEVRVSEPLNTPTTLL